MALRLLLLFAAIPGLAGCATNAATFYEGTRFAFAAEYNPESGQPVNLTLGYKRRIAAIVPPQQPAPEPTETKPDPSHRGESLSLVSMFDVGPGGPQIGGGLIIKSAFASGMAARDLTNTPQAASNIRGLFAATTLPLRPPEVDARVRALAGALGKVNNADAEKVLIAAGLRAAPSPGCPKDREAICALQDALSTADEATLQRLESATTQVIFAPTK